jgi:hypothetical protein
MKIEKSRGEALRKTKPSGSKALRKTKKEQGGKPCSQNCVDPIFPKIGFDLD